MTIHSSRLILAVSAACASIVGLSQMEPAEARKPRTRTLTVRATVYSAASDPSGKTATGRRFSLPGVAVDPRIIPYGSKVTIPGYGRAMIADDTGRLIRGNRIDIRIPNASRSRLRRIGVRTMVITVTAPKRKRNGKK